MGKKQTIADMFYARVEELGDQEALHERQDGKWVSFSWGEWSTRSRALASALIEEGVRVGEHVAIFSYTRRQWVESDIAIIMAGACTVTVYHNLNSETVRYIAEDSGCRIVFAEGPIQLKALFEKGKLPAKLERVIYFTDHQTPLPTPGQGEPEEILLRDVVPEDKRDLLVPYEEFLSRGEEALASNSAELENRLLAVDSDDVAKVIYTSGTTGTPKGAMLTHRNLIFVVDSVQQGLNLRPEELMLSFLPLAHVYAQLAYHASLRVGFQTAFATSMLTAVDDAASIRPHFFTTVPRLFEKLHAGVLSQVEKAGGTKKAIFNWATKVGGKCSNLEQSGRRPGVSLRCQRSVADKLVFSKINERLGGRIRFMISGGAPLPQHTAEFFDSAGLLIIEGYGMTENASLSHYNRVDAVKFGTVGQPIPGVEQKIADDGEVVLRGPNTMLGYLNKPEETREVLSDDGWLYTGDIGFLDEEGYLTITDRKKEIIITAGGKNVPPAPVEAALCRSRFVSQAIVFGDRRKYLVSLLTLDREHAVSWAASNKISFDEYEELCKRVELVAAVQADIDKINTTLDPFSTIKKFAIVPRDFSIQDGEMTPSLKLRRRIIESRFSGILGGMYPSE